MQIQEFGAPDEVLIRIASQPTEEEQQESLSPKVKEALGDTVEYRRTEIVGPTISGELIAGGTLAVVVAMIGIMIYVWFRFEWQFSLAAVASLVHDVTATIGLYALLQLEFNVSSIAAILTIIGYSLNDKVVIFDRIRENLRKYKRMPLKDLLDLSINEMLSRAILTHVTTPARHDAVSSSSAARRSTGLPSPCASASLSARIRRSSWLRRCSSFLACGATPSSPGTTARATP